VIHAAEEAAMPDAAVPPPPSVRYARALLFLQGSIWALGALVGVMAAAEALSGAWRGELWLLLALAGGWSACAGSMAAAKTLLAVRLGRGRSRRARKTVVTVELAMTGLGVLWFVAGAYTATGLAADLATLAGLAGAGLSLAAAVGLLRSGRTAARPA
jgi:hypothetical protein